MPKSERYYEDYDTGEIITAAGVTIAEADILDFAFRYDPQPFHLDKTAAEASIYQGLIASGWQTGLLGFRMQKPSSPVRSEEHTSELQSLMRISYAVFCLKKKKRKQI